MVQFLDNVDINKVADIIRFIFHFQDFFSEFVQVNYKEVGPCIYAMWHGNQCALHGLPEDKKGKIHIMISQSRDGLIISETVKKMGFNVVNGSTNREGAMKATLQMIKELQNGNCGAITVDGPRGPIHKCKNGIVKIAKKANVPIVPMLWYSSNPTFIKLPTWDKFSFPTLFTKMIVAFGEPVYINDMEDKDARQIIENALLKLDDDAPRLFEEAYRFGIWKRK